MHRLIVTCVRNGRVLLDSTVNARMEEADPGFWGLDHPLVWSCPVMAEHGRELVQYTLGHDYRAELVEAE